MPKVKCEYCGAYIDENDEKCPNCNGVNKYYKRFVNDTPKTIEDLKSWYKARKLPDEHITRFFIGKDIKEPKAFGIYQDGSDYVVYKNKADGSRSIRYQGKDEAYAVNELYMKLKSEILRQRSLSVSKGKSLKPDNIPAPLKIAGASAIFISMAILVFVFPFWVCTAIALVTIVSVILLRNRPQLLLVILPIIIIFSLSGSIIYYGFNKSLHRHDGYYSSNNNYYYFQGNDVYSYDNNDWNYYDSYDNFTQDNPDYSYVAHDYYGDEYYSDFSNTEYYDDSWESSSSSSSSSDWSSDSDYDWDSGSDWDSGGSDWDSDW